MWCEIDEVKEDVFRCLDPNPVHRKEQTGKGIDGCVSGLQLIQIAVQRSWKDTVFCATEINIKYIAPLYSKYVYEFEADISEEGAGRTVCFTFKQKGKVVCTGRIKQLLKRK